MSQEETYCLTPLGLFTTSLGYDQAKELADALELYMRRSGLGMAIDANRLAFVEMRFVEEEAK